MGNAKEAPMTITLRPEQEKVIRQAIEAGMYNSVDEVLDSALESIRKREPFHPALTRSQIAGQRIRELRAGVTLGGISIRELIEEGRE
jgi:Arc/MetJ-type ribon-helix-helix transcriptional regulator